MRLSRVTTPGALMLIPVAASAAAWLLPGASLELRGFAERAHVTPLGVLLLLLWYAACFGAIYLGVKAGETVRPPSWLRSAERDDRFDRRIYVLLTVLATIGVGYAVLHAQQSVGIVEALASNTANSFSESLGRSAGLATLRYTTAVAAPVGFFLWRAGRAPGALAVYNVLLLALSALFSSRLSLVMAMVVYAVLVTHFRPQQKVRIRLALIVGVLAFAALAALNLSRNGNYYRDAGVDNVASMNVYQISAYLGSPFQVALGTAGGSLDGSVPSRSTAGAATELLVPTFLGGNRDTTYSGGERYAYQVSISDSLTTNSAFADTFSEYGWWGLLYLPIGLCLAGLLFGHARRYTTVAAAAVCGVIGYGFAELWRLYLFNQGIVVYLVVALVVCVLVTAITLGPAGGRRRLDGRSTRPAPSASATVGT